MAQRAKSDEIVREQCLNVVQAAIGSKIVPVYGVIYSFVKETADLARAMFLSRKEREYISSYSIDDYDHASETIWAGTLFATAACFCKLTYDEVAEAANAEVADYLHFVVPDPTIAIFQSTPNLLCELGICNSKQEFGPILAVAAANILAIRRIGPEMKPIQNHLGKSSVMATVWGLRFTLDQLNKAFLTRWSEPVMNLINQTLKIIQRWTPLSNVTPKRTVSWKLDMSIPPRVKTLHIREL